MIYIIVYLLGLAFMQVYLSRKENPVFGLVIPALYIILAVIALETLLKGQLSVSSFFSFITGTKLGLPLLLYSLIYAAARLLRGRNRQEKAKRPGDGEIK